MKTTYVGESYPANEQEKRVRRSTLLGSAIGGFLVVAALLPSVASAPERKAKSVKAAVPVATVAIKATVTPPSPITAPKRASIPEISTPAPTPITTPEASTTNVPTGRTCTRLRRRPNEIMYGYLCSDKAKSAIVDSGYGDAGWVYSVVVNDGIYKCGYVRPGILPPFQPSKDALNRCKNYYLPLTRDRYSTLTNFNCPEVLPGVEGCRDGAKGAPPFSANNDTVTLYGNYATDKPSALNLYGTGDGGFSDPFKVPTALLRYRAQVSLGSRDGYAAIVRGDDNWGLVPLRLVDPENMSGGTPSLLSPNQLNKVFADPNSSAIYQELTSR